MGPIWDPSGQPAYGLTHMGPMPNPVALPIWVAHIVMFAGAVVVFRDLLFIATVEIRMRLSYK